ncbi:ribbon-helix-helix protein, CopG family [Raineyella sp. W15-4]|uniref:ribbon-helix-helix protein, CopG family n=1 Tax=Raineyella sp. W15-4 TaxID=3081651 RepID=UPI002953351D|nr:ribbon-helix-helix protein, CopG family [Raineyella sp. W15-4]WOQ16786.1 ribbon-helix-helix protein, CopG family [Raineyella sp. W15-4]
MTQIVVRVDSDTDRALTHLVKLTGQSRSEVVREAIRAAEREAVLERVRKQALAVRDDPADRAQMLALAEEMESLRAW